MHNLMVALVFFWWYYIIISGLRHSTENSPSVSAAVLHLAETIAHLTALTLYVVFMYKPQEPFVYVPQPVVDFAEYAVRH